MPGTAIDVKKTPARRDAAPDVWRSFRSELDRKRPYSLRERALKFQTMHRPWRATCFHYAPKCLRTLRQPAKSGGKLRDQKTPITGEKQNQNGQNHE